MMGTVVSRPRPLLPPDSTTKALFAYLYSSFGFKAPCLRYSSEEALYIMGSCSSVSGADSKKSV